jgi:tagatose 1,6-diphosphate aldolase
VLDNKERQPVYTFKDVAGFCDEVDGASELPWVILSAAVNIEEFLLNAEMATAAGASGFLCGRAIWKDCVGVFPQGREAMEGFLSETGAFNFARAIAAASRAMPWWDHPRFGGWENIQVAGASGEQWHQQFSAAAGQVKY